MLDGVLATSDCDPKRAEGPFSCGGDSYRGRVSHYENAEYVIDPGEDTNGDGTPDRAVMHGPRDDAVSPAHAARGGDAEFTTTGDHCGTCHNVTNPVVTVPSAEELEGASPAHLARTHAPIAGKPMPIERTHVEWSLSAFAAEGRAGTCQSCHMRATAGRSAVGGRMRPDLASHDTAGGNSWVPRMIPLFFADQSTPAMRESLERTARAAESTLRDAASLAVERFTEGLVVFRVTNRTGHLLPTGYPEGRRMWLHVEGRDAGGAVVFESGRYDPETAELAARDTLGKPARVWEILLGMYDRATRTAKHTFHFALNDVILKANRIPPRGFRIDAAASEGALVIREGEECERLPADLRNGCESYDWIAEPPGAERIAESWDLAAYDLPAAVTSVRATLRYQTASAEYVRFLSDPQRSGAYADRFVAGLLPAWEVTGKSAPSSMAETSAVRP
jgi:hypothetical protein